MFTSDRCIYYKQCYIAIYNNKDCICYIKLVVHNKVVTV